MFPFKKISFLLILSALFFVVPAISQANQNLYLKNSNNNVFRYGSQSVLTTTNATPTTIKTITVGNDEGGILEVTVVGLDSAHAAAVTGVKLVRYLKTAGTLTLGTAATPLATVTDTGLGSATFAVSASSNNIIVQVTGAASSTVKWIANIRQLHVP